MRLIDADELIKKFRYAEANTDEEKYMCAAVRRMIREQPTAYDADKVMKQLEEWTVNARVEMIEGIFKNYDIINAETVIEIVKKGGNENGKSSF